MIVPRCQGATSREESQACLSYPEARMLQGVSQGARMLQGVNQGARMHNKMHRNQEFYLSIAVQSYDEIQVL